MLTGSSTFPRQARSLCSSVLSISSSRSRRCVSSSTLRALKVPHYASPPITGKSKPQCATKQLRTRRHMWRAIFEYWLRSRNDECHLGEHVEAQRLAKVTNMSRGKCVFISLRICFPFFTLFVFLCFTSFSRSNKYGQIPITKALLPATLSPRVRCFRFVNTREEAGGGKEESFDVGAS